MATKERKFLGIVYYVHDESTKGGEEVASRQKTTATSWLVLISWLTSCSLIGAALFSTPYMQKVVEGRAAESFGECLVVFLLAAVFCGWPWLLAFIKGNIPGHEARALAFAVVAVLVATYTCISMSNAPSEGVGYAIVFGVLLIWLAYPVSRIFGP